MSESHSGYLVVLENDVHEDYVQEIITALKMVKCVVDVVPVVADPASWIIAERVKRELFEKVRMVFANEKSK